MTKETAEDLDIMARTMYGEARGEGDLGLQAVAHVIVNRANIRYRGNTAKEVCLAYKQFSCWNDTDPQKLIITHLSKTDTTYTRCYDIARGVKDGRFSDITYGATHYHTTAINPYWADKSKVTAVIGNHIFYKGIA